MPNKGLAECPCVRKRCPRFGKCDECVRHHLTHKRYPLPYCKRKRHGKNSMEPAAPETV